MTKIVILYSITIAIIIAAACSAQADDKSLSFLEVPLEQAPDIIKNYLNDNKYYETAAVFEDASNMYLIINRGVMPTDGYNIIIDDIYLKNEHPVSIEVKVTYTTPSWDQNVSDMITYPAKVVKIKRIELSDNSSINFIEDGRIIASIQKKDIISEQ